jgi:23S rRNA (guanosine2251-2'-O)-methyltransferase
VESTNPKLKLEELNRPTVEEFVAREKFPVIVVLDNIRSLNNVGSFFRTCDAFNVEALYLVGITATPPHREIQKTALGATHSVKWQYFETIHICLSALKADNYQVLAIEQATTTKFLQDVDFNAFKKIALVFGNEVDGVTQEVIDQADAVIEIPQFGTKHSLNVSVAGGAVLWEVVRQLMPKKIKWA